MRGTILIAGASGVVGHPLCELLIGDGWRVVGTTRSPGKAEGLRSIGVEPRVVDVFDAAALVAAVSHVQPQVVIHQLTDLPDALDPAQMTEGRRRNARIREEGTRNLVAAAIAGGARRVIAQSIAFAYAPGPLPFTEESPLGDAPPVKSLEAQVLGGPFEGIVLRYGKFYGPGTGFERPPAEGPVHVEAAADAARRAVTRGAPGVYNVVEDDGTVASAKASRELGWRADFRVERGHARGRAPIP